MARQSSLSVLVPMTYARALFHPFRLPWKKIALLGGLCISVFNAVLSHAVACNLASQNGIACVQTASKTINSGTQSGTIAFPNSNVAGHLIVVVVRAAGGTTSLPSDTLVNTYVANASIVNVSQGTNRLSIYYAANIAAGSNTVTVCAPCAIGMRVAIFEYSGLATANVLDQGAGTTGNSATPGSPSVTTMSSPELVIGALNTGSAVSITNGTGYTIEQCRDSCAAGTLGTEDRILSTPQSVVANWTVGSQVNWASTVATFRPPGAPLSYSARTDLCVQGYGIDPTGYCVNGAITGQKGSAMSFRMRPSDGVPFSSLAPANTAAVDADFNSYMALVTDRSSAVLSTAFHLGSGGSYNAWNTDSTLLLVQTSGNAAYLYYVDTAALLTHNTCTPSVKCFQYTGIKTAGSGDGDTTHLAHSGAWTFSSLTSNMFFELVSSHTKIQKRTVNGLPGCAATQTCTLTAPATYVDFTSSASVNCGNTAPAGGLDRVAGEILPSDYSSTYAGTLVNALDDSIAVVLGGAGNWHATTTYTTTESFILPQTGNAGNYGFQATTGGTSGSSAPTWPQTVGATVTDGGVTWTNIDKLGGQGPAFDYIAFRPSTAPNPGCSRINTRIGKIYRGNGLSSLPAGTWQTDNTNVCGGLAQCDLLDLMTLHDGSSFGNGGYAAFSATGSETQCLGGSPGFVAGNCSCRYNGPSEHDYCAGYFWKIDSLLIRPCTDTDCQGHSAKGYNLSFRAKAYTAHLDDNPSTGGNPGSANPGTQLFDPTKPFPTDQHGTYNNGGPDDAQPVFAMSAWVPAAGRVPSEAYTLAWSGEDVAVKPDGSHTTYRFAHNYNTGSVGIFGGQNAIGNVSQDGRFFAVPTDMMGLRGSTSGDWPGTSQSVAAGTTINPLLHNTGNYTYLATTGGSTCSPTGCEPNFDSACVTTCTDGSVTWTRTASPCNQLRGDIGWAKNGLVALGDQLFPIASNTAGNIFQALNSGTIGSSQPDWSSVLYGQTITDSAGITWKNIGANDCRTDIMVVDLKSAHGN